MRSRRIRADLVTRWEIEVDARHRRRRGPKGEGRGFDNLANVQGDLSASMQGLH